MDPEVAEEPVKQFCSNCKQDIAAGQFMLHEFRCKKHTALCEICGEPVPKTELDSHYEEEHAPIPCDFCQEKIPREEMDAHKENRCPDKPMHCKYCELDIRRADYQEHVEGCGSRTDICELCAKRVMLKDMYEHQHNKCGHIKSEEPLELPQWEDWETTPLVTAPEVYFARRSVLSPDGIPRYQSVVVTPLRHDFVPPFVADHAYHPPPQSEPPLSNEHSGNDSLHIDPQWLALVADVCGEENVDQVVAQNMMVEDYRHPNPPPAHAYHSAGAGAESRQVPVQRYEPSRGHLDEARDRLTDEADVVRSKNGGGVGRRPGRDEEQEKRDEEMAWRIHNRDLAYAQKRAESAGNHSSHDTEVDDDSFGVGKRPTRNEREEMDSEIAWKIHQRDLYTTSKDRPSDEHDHDMLTFEKVRVKNGDLDEVRRKDAEQERLDEEMARKLYQRDLEYAQKRASNGDKMQDAELAGQLERDHVYAPHIESDAELARQLQEEDHDHVHGSSDISHREPGLGHYDVDAKLAEEKYRREAAYVESLKRDEALAQRLQQEEKQFRDYSDDIVPQHVTEDYYPPPLTTGEKYRREADYVESLKRDEALAQRLQQEEEGKRFHDDIVPQHVTEDYYPPPLTTGDTQVPFYHDDDDYKPVMDQDVERDSTSASSLLAQKLMLEEEEGEGVSWIPERYDEGVLSSEQPRAKYLPQLVKEHQDSEMIPCEYCSELFPYELVSDHQKLCYVTAGPRSTHDSQHFTDLPQSHTRSRKDETRLPFSSRRSETKRAVQPSLSYSKEDMTSSGHRVEKVPVRREELPSPSVPTIYTEDHGRVSLSSENTEEEGVLLTDELLKQISSTSFSKPRHLHDPVGVGKGSSASYTQDPETESGPCEVCGELIPVHDLIKHESTCHVHHKKDEVVTISATKPVKSVEHTTRAAEVRATPNSRNGINLAIRFPQQNPPQYAYSRPSEKLLASTGTSSRKGYHPSSSTTDSVKTRHPSSGGLSSKKSTGYSSTADSVKTRHSPTVSNGGLSSKKSTGYSSTADSVKTRHSPTVSNGGLSSKKSTGYSSTTETRHSPTVSNGGLNSKKSTGYSKAGKSTTNKAVAGYPSSSLHHSENYRRSSSKTHSEPELGVEGVSVATKPRGGRVVETSRSEEGAAHRNTQSKTSKKYPYPSPPHHNKRRERGERL